MAESSVGPWAKDKLARLAKYLHEYTKIMRKQDWCEGFHYIDAFAGPGAHVVRGRRGESSSPQRRLFESVGYAAYEPEQREFVRGSPAVALDVEYPFTSYVFVEKNPRRVAELEKLREKYGGTRRIVIRRADCNRYLLDKVVANPAIDWKRNRALVFLDPFGMQVPWSTLKALGQTHSIEVFLNFPEGMAIQRLLPRDPSKLTAKRRAMLDEYFGSPEWFDLLYATRTQPRLFDDDAEEKVKQPGKRLVKWYRERLRGAFGYASKAALIRNTRRAHLYYLLLASPNRTGVRIADHILGAGEAV